jgi:hypothetical protein
VAAALLVRVLAMLALGLPGDVPSAARAWDWAYEQGAVAQALLRGDGYADPFGQGTGATAWCGPVFPLVLAGLMRLFGGVTNTTALALSGLQVVLSALVCRHLVRLGDALGQARVGALAAWGWALHPIGVYSSITIVWDSVFVAFALTWLLAAVARRGPGAAPRTLALLGLGVGAVGLLNPAPLVVAPAILAFVLRGRTDRARASLCLALPALLVVAPWSARNYARLGTPGLKANLGVELMVGNTDGADGGFHPWVHPAYNERQLELYRDLGERDYAALCMRHFRAWVRNHPGAFARLTLIRARTFWLGHDPFSDMPLRSGAPQARDAQGWVKWWVHFLTGVLALAGLVAYRDRRGGAWLVRGTALLFPLVYYVTHVLERYRFPIEPLVTYLAAWVGLALVERRRRRR